MTETVDPLALRDLLATPPSEFVAARNALAKSLRAERRREEAAAVTGLRRPSWVDWALNAIAGSAESEVERFADTAAALRDAQAAAIEGRDGPDLRTALRALREATTALARLASGALTDAGRAPDAAEVAARLGEVAASDGATQQLRAGVLGSGDPDDPGPFGDALGRPPKAARRAGVASPSTTSKRTAKGRGRDGAGDGVDELAERRVAAEARKAEERQRQEEAAAAAAAEEAARLERDREVASADVGVAESMLADAETALADAEQAVTDARAAVIQAKSTLRTARQRVEHLSRRG